MRTVRAKILISAVLIGILASFLMASLGVPNVLAAPSGGVEVKSDNILELGESAEVVVTFRNSATTGPGDVASTIQFITLAAANLNPSRTLIALGASWEIWVSEAAPSPRVSGAVIGIMDSAAIYSPYSTSETIYLYTWALGKPNGLSNLDAYTNSGQFADDLRILRPGEFLKLKITAQCQGVVGDSRIWFFFRATKFQPSSAPVDISVIPASERVNLYYQDTALPRRPVGWWPLHNSYDPYDLDIETGHAFEQVGRSPHYAWTRVPTTSAFAKSNKLEHQKPVEDPPANLFSFHICGVKFDDLDRDGEYDVEVEPGIDEVVVVLLGPDEETKAEDYYPGKFSYPPPEENPLETGENELQGSYCFNLAEVTGGTYTFYLREEVPQGWNATTPTLIGPITLEASDAGPREDINNHFGNARPTAGPAVGVPAFPALYVGVAAAFGTGILAYFIRRRLVDQK